MTDTPEVAEVSPLEAFLEDTRTQLEQTRRQLNEINLLVEQSQGEVDKLVQRNSTITSRLHQLQAQFDTVPREDIRATYESAQDTQQRLFTMRGQLEKLQSDQGHLAKLAEHLTRTLQLLEGEQSLEVQDASGPVDSAVEQIIQAQEEERRKISRQIHDGPAQALSNFILQTEIALRLFDGDQERARQELTNLKDSAAATFGQVRDYIFDLRPMMLDDLGLVPTVRRYSEAFEEKSGVDINLIVTGSERRIESHLEVLVFRSIQDLLANVREHAQATQVKVSVDLDESQVRVSVEDNGRGFDPEAAMEDETAGRSLRLLRERISQVGGTFGIDRTEAQNTRVSFSVPTSE